MAYNPIDFKNLPDTTTPVNATNLNHIQKQYQEANAYTDAQVAANMGGEDYRTTIDALPATGIVSAHRSGGDTRYPMVGPEGSIAGARISVALGANMVDVDYRTTADGTMVVLHDTTVNRETVGDGLITNHVVSALPNLAARRWVGDGWAETPMLTIEEYLRTISGSVVVTIEAKEGVAAVAPLAALIKRLGLEASVFINTNNVDVVEAIVAEGLYAHFWGQNNPERLLPAVEAGATLFEATNSTDPSILSAIVNAINDPDKNARWLIHAPIYTREQRDAMLPLFMGHVSDAIGMTNRPGNDRLVTTISPSLAAGKRGIGWFKAPSMGPIRIEHGGIVSTARTGAADDTIYLGDLSSDTLPSNYTLNFSFIASASQVGTVNQVRLRMACTLPNSTGLDADTDGYVVGLRGNGELAAWESPVGGGGGTSIGTAAGPPLIAGTEYTVSIKVTPTTVEVSRSGVPAKIGPTTATRWRGGHVYIWFSGINTAGCKMTKVWYS